MSSGGFLPLQGMSDIAPPEVGLWQRVESEARRVLPLYGFEEIRTPVLERTSVFTRAIGEGTDVVQKEMYTFEDRGGRQVSLRPEGTAGVIRALCGLGPEFAEARVFYIGPMFRAERPQAGAVRPRRRMRSASRCRCIWSRRGACPARRSACTRVA
jgi:histidyl-tRNA synthetase